MAELKTFSGASTLPPASRDSRAEDELTIYYDVGRRLKRNTTQSGEIMLDLPEGVYVDSILIIAPETMNILSYKMTDKESRQLSLCLPKATARVQIGRTIVDGLLQDVTASAVSLRTEQGLKVISDYDSISITQRFPQQLLEISYLLAGLSWSAEYVILLDSKQDIIQTFNVKAQVINDTGYDFDLTNLKLVTGYPNKPTRLPTPRRASSMALATASVQPEMKYQEAPSLAPSLPRDYYTFPLGARKLSKQLKTDILSLSNIQGEKMYYYKLEQGNKEVSMGYELELGKGDITLPKGSIAIFEYTPSGLGDFMGSSKVEERPISKPFCFKIGTTPLIEPETLVSVKKEEKGILESGATNYVVTIQSTIKNYTQKEVKIFLSLPEIVTTGDIISSDCEVSRVLNGEMQIAGTLTAGLQTFKCRIVIQR